MSTWKGDYKREGFFLGLEITLLISPSLEVSELIWEKEERDMCLVFLPQLAGAHLRPEHMASGPWAARGRGKASWGVVKPCWAPGFSPALETGSV